jgi:uncharacterized caspase-like protein
LHFAVVTDKARGALTGVIAFAGHANTAVDALVLLTGEIVLTERAVGVTRALALEPVHAIHATSAVEARV